MHTLPITSTLASQVGIRSLASDFGDELGNDCVAADVHLLK